MEALPTPILLLIEYKWIFFLIIVAILFRRSIRDLLSRLMSFEYSKGRAKAAFSMAVSKADSWSSKVKPTKKSKSVMSESEIQERLSETDPRIAVDKTWVKVNTASINYYNKKLHDLQKKIADFDIDTIPPKQQVDELYDNGHLTEAQHKLFHWIDIGHSAIAKDYMIKPDKKSVKIFISSATNYINSIDQ